MASSKLRLKLVLTVVLTSTYANQLKYVVMAILNICILEYIAVLRGSLSLYLRAMLYWSIVRIPVLWQP